MYPQRAIFLALDAMFRAVDTHHGYRWECDPRLPGLLRDYRALGFRLVGILDPTAFGLALADYGERVELVAYATRILQEAGAAELDAVCVADDIADPRPIWDLRRRFGVELRHSVLVGMGPAYEALCRNAGIGRMEWARELLGPAFEFAAA